MAGTKTVRCSLLVIVAVAAALLVAPGSSASSGRDDRLPPGWRVASTSDNALQVTWRSESVLPMGDARPEFRLGGELLGYPRLSPDGHRLTLSLPAEPAGDLSGLSVWLSGRRLDAPGAPGNPPGGVASTPYEAPPAGAALGVDPGQPGPYEIKTVNYTLDDQPLAGFPVPVEMVGHVVAPTDAPDARPFVLFLHGRHYTCYTPGTGNISGNWPCRPKERPVPSHLGYDYAQRLLASQGYVTVSISANGINAQDWRLHDGGAGARSTLVRRHLRQWANWESASGVTTVPGDGGKSWRGEVDRDRTLLVGHSRGGEGVDRAAIETRAGAPWTIAAQVLIAPTAFGRQEAPYVPTVVLLPYCDGDVIDLQGQGYVDVGRDVLRDDKALRSSVLTMGANHNYFNSQWTPGVAVAPSFDDWYGNQDPVCGKSSPERLTGAEQRRLGGSYVAAAARLLIAGDERVLAMFDGSNVTVPSAGDVDVRTSALGARRRLVRPGGDAGAVGSGDAQVRLCRGKAGGRDPAQCGSRISPVRTPHWPGSWLGPVPTDPALEFAWDEAGATGGLALTSPWDVRDATHLDARVIVNPRTGPVRLDVRLVDDSGAAETLTPRWQGRLPALPGDSPLGKLWAQTLRVPLDQASEVDLGSLTRIELVARTAAGEVWLLDVAARRPGLAPVSGERAAVVDVGNASVVEGDGPGDGVLEMPVTVHGQLTRPARIRVQVVGFESRRQPRPFVLELSPGQQHAVVEVPYERDRRDDPAVTRYGVAMWPLRGAMTGDYLGIGRVLDDDPTPRARMSVTDRRVGEGAVLRWQIRLDKPLDYYTFYRLAIVRSPNAMRQLSTADVPERWLREYGIRPPKQPIALTALDVRLYVLLRPGDRTAVIRVPTAVDRSLEGNEALALRVQRHRTIPELMVRTVIVDDH